MTNRDELFKTVREALNIFAVPFISSVKIDTGLGGPALHKCK